MITEEDKLRAVALIKELRDIAGDPGTYKKPQEERNKIAERMKEIKAELEAIKKRSKDV